MIEFYRHSENIVTYSETADRETKQYTKTLGESRFSNSEIRALIGKVPFSVIVKAYSTRLQTITV